MEILGCLFANDRPKRVKLKVTKNSISPINDEFPQFSHSTAFTGVVRNVI